MYEECPALLQMTRTFLEDGEKDEIIHHCKVIRYRSGRREHILNCRKIRYHKFFAGWSI